MPSEKTSLVLGLFSLGMLIYAFAVMIQGLVNGEKLMGMKYQAPVTISRWRNPIAFWVYTAIDAAACVFLGYCAFHFLSAYFGRV